MIIFYLGIKVCKVEENMTLIKSAKVSYYNADPWKNAKIE